MKRRGGELEWRRGAERRGGEREEHRMSRGGQEGRSRGLEVEGKGGE